MTDENAPAAPAGWYPAAHAGGAMRYWDGAAWTDGPPAVQNAPTAPVAPEQTPRPPATPVPQAPYGSPAATTQYIGGPHQTPPAPRRRTSIAALILGIIALLLCWVPVLGLTLAIAALIVGIVALLRRQPRRLSITGTAMASVAMVVAVIVTVSFSAFLSGRPGVADGAPVTSPAASETPKPTASTAKPAATPQPTTAPTPASPDLSAYEKIADRDFALLAKDPDAYVGDRIIVYGVINQLDSATGQCGALASTGGARQDESWDYEQNTYITAGDGESNCPPFDPLVEDDHVKLWVTVAGSLSYDTQIGGNTTVPAFFVDKVKMLPSLDY